MLEHPAIRCIKLAGAAIIAASLMACGGGGTTDTPVVDVTPATITAAPATINRGDNYSQVYTTTLTARTASGAAATLEQSNFAAPTFVDVPKSTTFGLSPTGVPGEYTLVVSTTVGGSGLPVAVSGTTLNLKDTIYYTVSGRRVQFDVPIVLSCAQPAYAGTSRCQGSGSGSSSTAGGPSTGGTGGTGNGGGGGTTSRQFIDWTGSANGEIVKDANNEDFAFYEDTGCLYSFNRREETTNFCLYPNASDGLFAGRRVSVVSARSTSGSCIAVMADPLTGNVIDIVTSPSGVQTVTVSSVRADAC